MIIKANYTLAEGVSKEAQDILKCLLEKDPLTRISIQGILAHPWMRDAKDQVELFTNAEKNFMISQLLSSSEHPADFFSDQMMESNDQ